MPAFLNTRTTNHLQNATKIFVAVVNELFPPDFRSQKIRKERVQIIGGQDVATDKQQVEEKAQVEFRIKEWAFVKKEAEAAALVGTVINGLGVFQPPAHQANLKAAIQQGMAHLVQPLVGEDVVGYR